MIRQIQNETEDKVVNHRPLPIGIDNFEKLVTRGYYLVDKTLLIKDLIDNKADVNLFTRPRRFGKTLNMSMLQYFFEDERNEFDGSKDDALRQIEEKKYELELKDDGYNNVIKYGISFFKKDCFVKMKEHQSN